MVEQRFRLSGITTGSNGRQSGPLSPVSTTTGSSFLDGKGMEAIGRRTRERGAGDAPGSGTVEWTGASFRFQACVSLFRCNGECKANVYVGGCMCFCVCVSNRIGVGVECGESTNLTETGRGTGRSLDSPPVLIHFVPDFIRSFVFLIDMCAQ